MKPKPKPPKPKPSEIGDWESEGGSVKDSAFRLEDAGTPLLRIGDQIYQGKPGESHEEAFEDDELDQGVAGVVQMNGEPYWYDQAYKYKGNDDRHWPYGPDTSSVMDEWDEKFGAAVNQLGWTRQQQIDDQLPVLYHRPTDRVYIGGPGQGHHEVQTHSGLHADDTDEYEHGVISRATNTIHWSGDVPPQANEVVSQVYGQPVREDYDTWHTMWSSTADGTAIVQPDVSVTNITDTTNTTANDPSPTNASRAYDTPLAELLAHLDASIPATQAGINGNSCVDTAVSALPSEPDALGWRDNVTHSEHILPAIQGPGSDGSAISECGVTVNAGHALTENRPSFKALLTSKSIRETQERPARSWKILSNNHEAAPAIPGPIFDGTEQIPSTGLYHVAPTQDRTRILQHGLQVSNPHINPRWEYQLAEVNQPKGVYATDNPQDAQAWKNWDWTPPMPPGSDDWTDDQWEDWDDQHSEPPPEHTNSFDVWHIPAEQIKSAQKDEHAKNAWIINHTVFPNLHQPVEHDWKWPGDTRPINWEKPAPYMDIGRPTNRKRLPLAKIGSHTPEGAEPWEPGIWGKGFGTQDRLYTWRVNENRAPHHGDFSTPLLNQGQSAKAMFDIYPDGQIAYAYGTPEEIAHLWGQDPRLREKAPEGWQNKFARSPDGTDPEVVHVPDDDPYRPKELPSIVDWRNLTERNYDWSHGTDDFPYFWDRKRGQVHVGPLDWYHSDLADNMAQTEYGNPLVMDNDISRWAMGRSGMYRALHAPVFHALENHGIHLPGNSEETWQNLFSNTGRKVNGNSIKGSWKIATRPLDETWTDKFAKVAKETPGQRQRRWENLISEFPDRSKVLHQTPEGWTIRHLPTYGDVSRTGMLMQNCWKGTCTYSDQSREFDPHNAHHRYSLNDPTGMPQVAFFIKHPQHSADTTEVQEALGARNRPPLPEHEAMLQEWAKNQGYHYRPADYNNPLLEVGEDEPTDLVGNRFDAATHPQFVWHDAGEQDPGRGQGYRGDHSMLWDPNGTIHIGTEPMQHANLYDATGNDPRMRPFYVYDSAFGSEGMDDQTHDYLYNLMNRMHQNKFGEHLINTRKGDWEDRFSSWTTIAFEDPTGSYDDEMSKEEEMKHYDIRDPYKDFDQNEPIRKVHIPGDYKQHMAPEEDASSGRMQDWKDYNSHDAPLVFDGKRFYQGPPASYHWDMIAHEPELRQHMVMENYMKENPYRSTLPESRKGLAIGRFNPVTETTSWYHRGRYHPEKFDQLVNQVYNPGYDESEDLGFSSPQEQWHNLFAKVSTHNLVWEPGWPGKGIYHNGELTTWGTNSNVQTQAWPHHIHMWKQKYPNEVLDIRNPNTLLLNIEPEGQVREAHPFNGKWPEEIYNIEPRFKRWEEKSWNSEFS